MRKRLQRLANPRLGIRLRQTQIQRSERDILPHGRGEQLIVRLLQHQPDPTPPLVERAPVVTGGATLHPNLAPGGPQGPIEVQQQRGLAGPVGTENRQLAAPLDAQVQIAQRDDPSRIAVFQLASRQQRRAHGHSRASKPPASPISATPASATVRRGQDRGRSGVKTRSSPV
jgi:hypothetical protein